jgi:hypothetical protein
MSTVKDVGEPGAGEPHARFDEAAGGNWHQSGSHTPHGAGASRRPYRDPRRCPLSRLVPSESAPRASADARFSKDGMTRDPLSSSATIRAGVNQAESEEVACDDRNGL